MRSMTRILAGRAGGPEDLPTLPARLRRHSSAEFLWLNPVFILPSSLMNSRDLRDDVGLNIRPSFITDEAAYRTPASMRDDRAGHRGTIGRRPGTARRRRDLLAVQGWTDRCWGQPVCNYLEGARCARGFIARDGSKFLRQDQGADTVGVGDTAFNAGVMAALNAAGVLSKDALSTLDSTTVRAALELGVRSAAVTVISRPCQTRPGFP